MTHIVQDVKLLDAPVVSLVSHLIGFSDTIREAVFVNSHNEVAILFMDAIGYSCGLGIYISFAQRCVSIQHLPTLTAHDVVVDPTASDGRCKSVGFGLLCE
jgi:hypothetical protein